MGKKSRCYRRVVNMAIKYLICAFIQLTDIVYIGAMQKESLYFYLFKLFLLIILKSIANKVLLYFLRKKQN